MAQNPSESSQRGPPWWAIFPLVVAVLMAIERTKKGTIPFPGPGYRAVCAKCGWEGFNYSTREQAQRSFDNHIKRSSRHR